MTYATQTDLITRFSADEILQRADPALSGAIDPTIVAAALQDADEVVNGHIAPRYALPLSPVVPGMIVRIAANVARFYLWKDGASERVRQGYDDALRDLERIGKGVIRLECAGAEAPPAALGGDMAVQFHPASSSSRHLGGTGGGWDE